MAKLEIDIVTAERVVYSDTDVDEVIAPGSEGELAVLPRHAAFMTKLDAGVLVIKKGSEEIDMAVSGGFLEVRQNRVVVLADTAERAEEIDAERAEEARRRARERLVSRQAVDQTRAAASLQRSLARLRAVQRRRRRAGGPRP